MRGFVRRWSTPRWSSKVYYGRLFRAVTKETDRLTRIVGQRCTARAFRARPGANDGDCVAVSAVKACPRLT